MPVALVATLSFANNEGIQPVFLVDGKRYTVPSSFALARRLLKDGWLPDDTVRVVDRQSRPMMRPKPLAHLASFSIFESDERGIATSRYNPDKAEAFRVKMIEKQSQRTPCGGGGGPYDTL